MGYTTHLPGRVPHSHQLAQIQAVPERDMSREIETSERAVNWTPAAQRGSAVACDERFLPPPVTARESFVLRYPRCEQRTSSQRVALRCKPMYTAKPRVQSSTVHHAPPCARRRGSDMFFGLHGNVWHPRCDRRPALLEIRIRAAHHCAPGLALCHAVRGSGFARMSVWPPTCAEEPLEPRPPRIGRLP